MPPDTTQLLTDIKRDLTTLIGTRLRARANKGRRRVVEREGVLEETYPDLFVMRLDAEQHHRRISYTYADVLTGVVEVTVCEGDQERTLEYSAD